MIKIRLKLFLPLCGLLFLFSCRTEELLHEIEQKEELSKKFITFTKKHENDVVNYGEGFKTLALRYDSIHNKNLTGIREINDLDTLKEYSNDISYIDFSVRSQLIEEENGDKWMLFPKVKNGKLEDLVVALLSDEETKLGYYLVNKDSEIYQKNIISFTKVYLSRIKNNLNKRYYRGEDYVQYAICGKDKDDPCSIEEVIIRIPPRNPGGGAVSFIPFPDFGGGSMACSEFVSCLPEGGGGWNYPSAPPKSNPCEKAKEGKTNAEKVIRNSVVKEKMDKVLRNKLGSNNEWAVSIGQNADGSYSVSKELEGLPARGNVPDVTSGNYVGDGHTHSGSGVPSPGDFYGMLKVMEKNIHYQVRFVYGKLYGNEEVYALIITDRNLAMQFLANYPMEQHFDYDGHTFKEGSSIFEDYDRIEKIGYNGYYNMSDMYGDKAIAMSYVLDKYNTGIALVKQNKKGKFESFKVTETPYKDKLAGGKVKDGATITSPCP